MLYRSLHTVARATGDIYTKSKCKDLLSSVQRRAVHDKETNKLNMIRVLMHAFLAIVCCCDEIATFALLVCLVQSLVYELQSAQYLRGLALAYTLW